MSSARPSASSFRNHPQALRDQINRRLYSVTNGGSRFQIGACGAIGQSLTTSSESNSPWPGVEHRQQGTAQALHIVLHERRRWHSGCQGTTAAAAGPEGGGLLRQVLAASQHRRNWSAGLHTARAGKQGSGGGRLWEEQKHHSQRWGGWLPINAGKPSSGAADLYGRVSLRSSSGAEGGAEGDGGIGAGQASDGCPKGEEGSGILFSQAVKMDVCFYSRHEPVQNG